MIKRRGRSATAASVGRDRSRENLAPLLRGVDRDYAAPPAQGDCVTRRSAVRAPADAAPPHVPRPLISSPAGGAPHPSRWHAHGAAEFFVHCNQLLARPLVRNLVAECQATMCCQHATLLARIMGRCPILHNVSKIRI